MSNSTEFIIFYSASSYVNKICTDVIYCVVFSLSILSFIWTIYFIFRLEKETKELKRMSKMENSNQRDSWLMKKKNCERKIIKNKFLIAICTIEWLMTFSIWFMTTSTDLKDVLTPGDLHVPKTDLTNCLYTTMSGNFLSKLLITSILVILMLLITLIKTLTQYLCQQYSYNPDTSFKLRNMLERATIVLILFFLIGLVRPLIIFQWIIGCIIFTYEFIRYAKSSNQLSNSLKMRSFDASKHEYQPNYIVSHYKSIYLEYKVGSFILVTAFFIHAFELIAFTIFSFIWLILSSPNNWFQILFLNDKKVEFDSLPVHYQQKLNIFAIAFSNLELLSLSVGWSLVVIPYIIVSLNKVFRGLINAFTKNKDYPSHDLIQALIDKRNNEYTRY